MKDKYKEPIFVTKPTLSEFNEYISYLKKIWETGILTQNGPFVNELENKLNEKLGTKYLIALSNGTISIQLAIKALKLNGEIITTPFTWIATCSAILWEKCKPVFVDINPDTLNIDVNKIENAINNKTCAILPVHVFSNPCQIEEINYIAKKNNLKVIYDAAHAMFVNYKNKSIFNYGDISVTSFHATKIFNTAEGGASITINKKIYNEMKKLRFFGFNETKEIIGHGCNAKMSEIHAALGLANLKKIDEILFKRKKIYYQYYNLLKELDFISFQNFISDSYNYSYVPIIFNKEKELIDVKERLNSYNIFPRRYFYPSLNTVKIIGNNNKMEISESISKRVLCLPSYHDLTEEMIIDICQIIKNSKK